MELSGHQRKNADIRGHVRHLGVHSVICDLFLHKLKANIMARKEGNFLRGAAGPVIYRVVRGKQIVSIKPAPGTVKQSEGTKVSSQIFGMASSWGANIRRTFEINAEAKFDSTVSQRLTGALRRVLGRCRNSVTKHYEFQEDSFKDLLSFDFNINSKVKSLMPVIPAVSIEEGVMQVMVNELLIKRRIDFG
jgi:hypothetical protein